MEKEKEGGERREEGGRRGGGVRGRDKGERGRMGKRGGWKGKKESGRRGSGQMSLQECMWWCCMESVAILKKEHVGISMAYIRHGSG